MLRYSPSQPVEISIPPGQEWQGRIYIGGNVTTPGSYPFISRDSLEALIQAAGGATSSANLSELKLYIPAVGEECQGRIYIGGNVTTPGFYPFTSGDSLEALIQTAGGITSSANLSELKLKLYILEMGEEQEPQKVDINRAEVWLLKTLPGIGETLAQRIVAYRQQNGPFRNIGEIVKVAGIGTTKYEQIKDLITVAD